METKNVLAALDQIHSYIDDVNMEFICFKSVIKSKEQLLDEAKEEIAGLNKLVLDEREDFQNQIELHKGQEFILKKRLELKEEELINLYGRLQIAHENKDMPTKILVEMMESLRKEKKHIINELERQRGRNNQLVSYMSKVLSREDLCFCCQYFDQEVVCEKCKKHKFDSWAFAYDER